MPIIGQPKLYYPKFRFVVEIDGVQNATFMSCSELGAEFAEISQWEGGVVIPHKSPGRMTFDDITLSRGVTTDTQLYLWWRSITDAASQTGLAEPYIKRNLDVVQLTREGTEAHRWRVFNTWPKRFVAGDWDNDSDENMIEQLVLAYDYFEKAGVGGGVASRL